MKKVVLILSITLLASCDKKVEPVESPSPTEVQEPEVKLTPLEEGKSLVEGADCLACHKINETMIGPAYQDVAAKYENTPENVDMLADKIINGTSGVWGSVPMAPHSGLSKENAKLMAAYVLSQKK
ncbi:c-type cytochrome [Chryseobacterium sp. T1]